MTSWLFNFSVSNKTGSLRRIFATIKFFDENEGAVFILHSSLAKEVKLYNKKNRYFFINQSLISRFFKNDGYVRNIVKECGQPDIYLSYGIPLYNRVGKVNWFHVSNALSLTVKNISLPTITKIKMLLLKHRICSTVDNVDIVSGESQYTIDLFENEVPSKKQIQFHILRNGYSSEDVSVIGQNYLGSEHDEYAMTIGIASYKRLDIVYKIFKNLQENNKILKKLYVVASPYDIPYMPALIPKNFNLDKDVVVDTFDEREELVKLMSGMKYFISASQIENGSNALLEGLIFSQNVIASDIPAHRELLAGLDYGYFSEEIDDEKFIYLENIDKDNFSKSISWEAVVKEMALIGDSVS